MTQILALFIGGGIGSLLRGMICFKINSHYATMAVNIIGAFMIGLLYEYFRLKTGIRTELKLFLMTGLLGGFTTFSTYLLDFMILFERQKSTEAFLYLSASVGLGIMALLAGMKTSVFFTD